MKINLCGKFLVMSFLVSISLFVHGDELDQLAYSLRAITTGLVYPANYLSWNSKQQNFWNMLTGSQQSFWVSLNSNQKALFLQCHLAADRHGVGRGRGGFYRGRGRGGMGFPRGRGRGGIGRGGRGGFGWAGCGPRGCNPGVSVPGIKRPDGIMGAGWRWRFLKGPNITFWQSLNPSQQNLLCSLTADEQKSLRDAYKTQLLQ